VVWVLMLGLLKKGGFKVVYCALSITFIFSTVPHDRIQL
jgi:hypothetical protein